MEFNRKKAIRKPEKSIFLRNMGNLIAGIDTICSFTCSDFIPGAQTVNSIPKLRAALDDSMTVTP
jgi:hypothetical protein